MIIVEGDSIISNDDIIANLMNRFFSNVVEKLNIRGYESEMVYDESLDSVENVISKFKNHPSIVKIKENIQIGVPFSFRLSNEADMNEMIKNLNPSKPTTFNNIPAKVLIENKDIVSKYICKFYNESIENMNFPETLKNADITPVFKKDEKTSKENYRPISTLPTVSKLFERKMYNQIYAYMKNYLSNYLCGFREGFSTEYCLLVMLEKWKRSLDKKDTAGAILTDLSKALVCLNPELLIAKLAAYGFDKQSLSYIHSYLTDRKHRTKINNSFSEWHKVKSGVPKGSILGPLLFNLYLNDIFIL